MTRKISVSGFKPERYVGKRIMEVPLSLIDEPRRATERGLQGYRSPGRVRHYAKMLKEGKPQPPIELILTISVDRRPLKKPFTIYNGEHRYGAAVLARRQTIPAVVAWAEKDGPLDDEEFETDEAKVANAEPVLAWAKSEAWGDTIDDEDDEDFLLSEPSDEELFAVCEDEKGCETDEDAEAREGS